MVLVNGLKRQKRNVRLKRLKTKCLEASLLLVMTKKMNMMMLTKMILQIRYYESSLLLQPLD